jgi:hypothetical protein
MSKEQESSMFLSLDKLQDLGDKRIESEEAAIEEAEVAEEQARLDAEQQAAEEEEARVREEEERAAAEQQARATEEARLEGLKKGIVEKAVIKAEADAQQIAANATAAHTEKLAGIEQDEHKKKLRNGLIALGAIVLVAVPVVGYLSYSSQQENQQRIAAQDAETERLRQAAAKQERKLNEKLALIKDLSEQIKNSADPAALADLREKLKKATSEAGALKQYRPGPAKNSTASPVAAPGPAPCQTGDPLCGNLE